MVATEVAFSSNQVIENGTLVWLRCDIDYVSMLWHVSVQLEPSIRQLTKPVIQVRAAAAHVQRLERMQRGKSLKFVDL